MPLILGTAMWGWTTSPAMAMTLLDQFYAAGGRAVDTATNYPINKNPGDFRQAERMLADWIRATMTEATPLVLASIVVSRATKPGRRKGANIPLTPTL